MPEVLFPEINPQSAKQIMCIYKELQDQAIYLKHWPHIIKLKVL